MIVLYFLIVCAVTMNFAANSNILLQQEIANLDTDYNFDTICDHLCVCYETTHFNTIPMWVVDCSVRQLQHFYFNVSVPTMIVSLDVSRNKIDTLKDTPDLLMSQTIEYIDISRNRIHTISEGYFKRLNRLIKLDLSENNLSSIPIGVFNGLEFLQELDLSFNRFTTLPNNIFHQLHHLKVLSLSYNPLGPFIIARNFIHNTNLTNQLQVLRLENTSVTQIPTWVNTLSVLTELYLCENSIQELRLLQPSLQVLDISGTKIKSLKSSALNYPLLKSLIVNRAYNLTTIESYAFYYLDQIEVISLQNCIALTAFPDLAFGIEKISETFPDHTLKVLSLARCGIITLNHSLIHFLKRTELVELEGNPWHCSCNLEWIRKLNLDSSHLLRCESPELYHSIPFTNITYQLCHTNTKSISMSTVVFVCLFFIILILASLIIYKGPFANNSKLHIMGRLGPTSPYSPYSQVAINPNLAESVY